jgi:hypothetical protein
MKRAGLTSDCIFCGKGEFRVSETRYYCSHCQMTVWKNGMEFRGIPLITEDRARKLLKGKKAIFTCVARMTGRPYDIEASLREDGRLDMDFAKRKRKRTS